MYFEPWMLNKGHWWRSFLHLADFPFHHISWWSSLYYDRASWYHSFRWVAANWCSWHKLRGLLHSYSWWILCQRGDNGWTSQPCKGTEYGAPDRDELGSRSVVHGENRPHRPLCSHWTWLRQASTSYLWDYHGHWNLDAFEWNHSILCSQLRFSSSQLP